MADTGNKKTSTLVYAATVVPIVATVGALVFAFKDYAVNGPDLPMVGEQPTFHASTQFALVFDCYSVAKSSLIVAVFAANYLKKWKALRATAILLLVVSTAQFTDSTVAWLSSPETLVSSLSQSWDHSLASDPHTLVQIQNSLDCCGFADAATGLVLTPFNNIDPHAPIPDSLPEDEANYCNLVGIGLVGIADVPGCRDPLINAFGERLSRVETAMYIVRFAQFVCLALLSCAGIWLSYREEKIEALVKRGCCLPGSPLLQ